MRVDTDDSATFCGGGVDETCNCNCTIPDIYEAGCVDHRCVVLGQGDCVPGYNPSCNTDPYSAVIIGVCNEDATCTCDEDSTLTPDGLCDSTP